MSSQRSKRYSYPSRRDSLRGVGLRLLQSASEEDREWILSYGRESSHERNLEEHEKEEEDEKTEVFVVSAVSSVSPCASNSQVQESGARRDAAGEDHAMPYVKPTSNGYCSSPTQASSTPGPVRSRSSSLTSSLRGLLQRQRQRSRPLSTSASTDTQQWSRTLQNAHQSIPAQNTASQVSRSRVAPSSAVAPQSEEAMDYFLAQVWSKDAAEDPQRVNLQYSRKLKDLKHFYELQLAEIAQREATYLSEYHDEATPLLKADQLSMNTDGQLQRALLEAQVHQKFNEIRFEMKQGIVQTIFALQAHHMATGRRRSWRPSASKVLNRWYEDHVGNPYPTEQEKAVLARQCGISVEKVSKWFSKKQTRKKSLVFSKSWGKKCATL